MRLSLAECAQLMPDVVPDRGIGSGWASYSAMMRPADHREGDDLPRNRWTRARGFRLALAVASRTYSK